MSLASRHSVMDAHVLVLNRLYQPVNVTCVRRAICMMVVGAAHALDKNFRLFDFADWASLATELGEEAIGLATTKLRIPRIVVLQVYDRVPLGRVRFSRQNIFVRDNFTCQYCAKQLPRRQLNLDHVAPRALGGKTHWENVVTSCIPCNFKKGAKTLAQAGLTLTRRPRMPSWAQMVQPARQGARYQEWLPFLNLVDASYWNAELHTD